MQKLTAIPLAGLALLVAACGTTVPQDQRAAGAQSAAGGGLSEVGGGTGASQPLPGAGGSTLAGQAPGSSGASVGGTTGTTGDAVGGSAGSSKTSGARGPAAIARGVTSTTVTIGAAIPTGTEAVGQTFGISGAGSVSEKAMWDAVIADVNKAGGVLGRKLVLYNHSVDFASYVANPEKTYGEVCADFKDDHKVYAAFLYIGDPSLRSCFASMGTPMILYGAFTTMPEAAYAANGANYLYGPDSITNERLAQLFVQSLVANSFMSTWDTTNGGPGIEPVKLGVIHADTPDQNNLYAAYARELAKYGRSFSDTITYSGSASDAVAATQSAVLKMKVDGITHVFGASAFFLRDAESQHYRPRYAYLPGLGALGAANSPAEQLKGAQTVGWAPMQDVNQPQDPGPTPGAARCTAVMRAAGLTSANRQDIKLMYAVCDAVYSFQEALTAGQQANVAGLRRGYEALGMGVRTALTFNGLFGPGRHYGVNSVRDMGYDSACACLKYTSRTNRS
ncbi:MAG: hypothetical protein M3N21_05235 [Actinomycetota bacterium]|nr:hypothetical protein [Actinomycetota bacterium]